MDETQRLSVSKESQKFVKNLADLPNDEYHKVKRGEEIDWYLKKNINIENYIYIKN
jgi:hypothetical protein